MKPKNQKPDRIASPIIVIDRFASCEQFIKALEIIQRANRDGYLLDRICLPDYFTITDKVTGKAETVDNTHKNKFYLEFEIHKP